MHDNNNTRITIGTNIHGYIVVNEKYIDKLNIHFYELKHIKTGANHIHLANDDTNNCFSVSFKTIPSNSNGVAHILEHTVLCGSKKYPIRDPFFSMIKRSLNTFMNAMTGPDKTLYPFCSQNEKDFYNLMDIYLDAAFYPLLNELDFMQEGHHIVFDNNTDPKLQISGVVYNEMKGSISNPANTMYRQILSSVFPTTTYHHNSGGTPSEIIKLSYDEFKDFHKKYYHPQNSYFYTYGSFPLDKHLETIDNKILSKYNTPGYNVTIEDEIRYDSPKTFTSYYPLDKNEDDGYKNHIAVSWLLSNITNQVEVLSFRMIEELLLGHPGAPLQKKLLESKLGKNLVSGTGYIDDIRETVFTAGLDGVNREDFNKIENIILETLQDVVKTGFSETDIQSAIHQIEFSTMEITGINKPYSINLLYRFLGIWIHGGDPLSALDFDKILEIVNQNIASGRYFENLIEKYLLNNNHRVTTILSPDSQMEASNKKELDDSLQKLFYSMTPDEINENININNKLKKHQDKTEDLSCLPIIKLEDLNKKETEINILPIKTSVSECQVSFYEQATNGITYNNFLFGLHQLTIDELELLPLFGTLLTKSGTKDKDYTKISEEINLYTGGITAYPKIVPDISNLSNSKKYLCINAASLEKNNSRQFDIVKEILLQWDFSNINRVKIVIKQLLSSLENSILRSGNSYANYLATRNFSAYSYYNNVFYGIDYIRKIIEISRLSDSNLLLLVDKLTKIGKKIFTSGNIRFFSTGSSNTFNNTEKYLSNLITSLSTDKYEPLQYDPLTGCEIDLKEAWITTTPVSYTAKSFPVPRYSDKSSAELKILSNFLTANYLHQEIREKGGAYGGSASYSPMTGTFSLSSYRDPNLNKTINIYDNVCRFMKNHGKKQTDIDELKVKIFGELDQPLSPSGKASYHYFSEISGLNSDIKNTYRDNILNTKIDDLAEIAFKYLSHKNAVAVITSNDILDREKSSNIFQKYNLLEP